MRSATSPPYRHCPRSWPKAAAPGSRRCRSCSPSPKRDRWSEHQAGAIWDASIVKIILGGASNSRDLQDLATLIGERDEITDSTTIGDHGSRTAQRSIRRVSIMPPDVIRTLPFGTGLILLRAAPPIVAKLRAWTRRKDASELQTQRRLVEELLQVGTPNT